MTIEIITLEIQALKHQINDVAKKLAKTPDSPTLQQEHDKLKKQIQSCLEQKQILVDQRKQQNSQYRAQQATDQLAVIEQYDIIQIIQDKTYYIRTQEGLQERDLEQLDRSIFHWPDKQARNDFHRLLKIHGRNRESQTFSFDKEPAWVFNKADGVREKWLQPQGALTQWQDYQYPPGLDAILNSISGGDSEIRLHLEQWIIRKYRNPGDYRLPAIVIYGTGGAAKNEFLIEVLGKIFVNGVAVTNFKTFTENAHALVGHPILAIDEAVDKKTDYTKVKAIIGNKTVNVKSLYQNVRLLPNIWGVWFIGNGEISPIGVVDDGTDRRITTIYLGRNIFDWVGDLIDKPYTKDQEQEFVKIWNKLKQEDFTSQKLSTWLQYLHLRFPDDVPVTGYHGEAHQASIRANRDPFDYIIDNILIADYVGKPEHFRCDELFDVYKVICNDDFSGRYALGKTKFYESLQKRCQQRRDLAWRYEERQSFSIDNHRGTCPMIVPETHQGPVRNFWDNSVFLDTSTGRPRLKKWLVSGDAGVSAWVSDQQQAELLKEKSKVFKVV